MGRIKDNVSQEYGYFERMVRENNPVERARLEDEYKTLSASNSALYEQYTRTIISDKNKELFKNVSDARKAFHVVTEGILKLIESNDKDSAYIYINDAFLPGYRRYRATLEECVEFNQARSTEMGDSINSIISRSTAIIISGVLVALIVSILIAVAIIRGTNKVLNAAIQAIDEGSTQVAAASSQVSSASNMLAEGASEQAASLEETSSSLEEMSSMTAHNAASAQEAKKVADEMRYAADESFEQMKEMQIAMNAIKESSSGISQIIKTIDEIAFQTNILALNAAVEAARAGEAGAGFAVVAEEVRNLAQRSANSAKETSVKIEGAINNSNNGVTISAKVATSLNSIVGKTRSMNELVSEIATASQEQDKGIAQLTTVVTEMDKVTQGNASNAEETASASEELNAHASTLKETVRELMSLVRKDAAPANGRISYVDNSSRSINHSAGTRSGHIETKQHSTFNNQLNHDKQRFLTMDSGRGQR